MPDLPLPALLGLIRGPVPTPAGRAYYSDMALAVGGANPLPAPTVYYFPQPGPRPWERWKVTSIHIPVSFVTAVGAGNPPVTEIQALIQMIADENRSIWSQSLSNIAMQNLPASAAGNQISNMSLDADFVNPLEIRNASSVKFQATIIANEDQTDIPVVGLGMRVQGSVNIDYIVEQSVINYQIH